MVESISKSVEEHDEIQLSFIGESNNGYGNVYIEIFHRLSYSWNRSLVLIH